MAAPAAAWAADAAAAALADPVAAALPAAAASSAAVAVHAVFVFWPASCSAVAAVPFQPEREPCHCLTACRQGHCHQPLSVARLATSG